MALDRRMQYFIEQIFPVIWARYLIPVKFTYLSEPTALKFRDISPELIELLSRAIWVQSKIAFHHWVQYLRKYYDRMVSSPKLFVMYVAYACNTMGTNIKDHYERFVTVCSLLVGFGANFHYSGNGEVLKYIPQILAVFFERVLMNQFSDRGGWKRLDKYLLRQEYLSWHDETQIICPDETETQRVTRQLNFAKKVEGAIIASACNDYDADAISEKDVEFDLVTCKITEEVMSYFTDGAKRSEQNGSMKLKSSATSEPIEDTEVEAHKKVMQGMMELVQRARLASIEKAKELEGVASGVACNIHPQSETFILMKCDSLEDKESVPKTTKKTNNQKKLSIESNISCSIGIESVERNNEENVNLDLEIGKTINNKEITEEDGTQVTFGILKDKLPLHYLQSTEVINTQMTLELEKNEEHDFTTILEKYSEPINKQTSEILGNDQLFSNPKSIEGTDLQTTSSFLGTSVSVHNHRKFTDSNDMEAICNVLFEDIRKQKSENQSDKLASTVSTEVKNVETAFQCIEENDRDSNSEKITECNSKQPSNLEDNENEVGIDNGFDAPKTANNAENDASSSSTPTNTKYKSKREAMNAMIEIIDNLAPKIEMFVVLLDSLVWDLQKET